MKAKPTYSIRSFHRYINYSTGQQEREPSAWDVWEITNTRQVVVESYDSAAAAAEGLKEYEAAALAALK